GTPCSLAPLRKNESLAKLPNLGWRDADRAQRQDEASPKHFWRTDPTAPARVKVRGPVRLAVETRLRYPVTESRIAQAHRIHVRAGSDLLQTLEYQTGFEDRWPVTVNDTP